MLKPSSGLARHLFWRTMLRAFHVETNVDQGGREEENHPPPALLPYNL